MESVSASCARALPLGASLSADLVVIGLGYVGLPLAQAAIHSGLSVTGLDVSPRVVDGLNSGRSHVDDLSDSDIEAMRESGFTATTDAGVLATADVAIICVPTPLDEAGGPDLGAVRSAVSMVREHLHQGQIIILESTTYPGTTDEEVRPALEAGGLIAGEHFELAFSPERIDPGNPVYGIKNTPKVVGGVTPSSTAAAAAFYRKFIDTVVEAKGAREAETAKLLENTYRHINIALVNEMARFCHELDIDLWDVINAAKTKPFGFHAFYPGPGVGGHCIPIDPNYLSYQVRAKLGYPFRFVELAQEINATMPAYVAQRIQDSLNDEAKAVRGSSILLLGVTYKPNIADERESPARPLAEALIAMGAEVTFHDPHVSTWNVAGTTMDVVPSLDAALSEADISVLLQAHNEYDVNAITEKAHRIFDTRGVIPAAANVSTL